MARAYSATQQMAPRIAPASLRDQLAALGRSFNGRAGISVVSLRDNWQADYNATTFFPQQSCSKLWVAITALDAVDKGRVNLNDRVTLGRDDLTLFHQPISARVLGKGGHTTTLGALLFIGFPRIQGPLWGLPGDAGSGKSGMSDTMAPGSMTWSEPRLSRWRISPLRRGR